MRVLILGISGMLGSRVFRTISENAKLEVYGTLRGADLLSNFRPDQHARIVTGLDVLNTAKLKEVISEIRPEIIINCVGLVKQLGSSKDPLVALPLNSMMPHQLVRIAADIGARVVHISTDCVFSGRKGHYIESDISDAEDLYGLSKYIGELNDFENAVTLRTSIIGHELSTNKSLIDWFLLQENQVKGFRKAIFSGLPTVELAHVIEKFVIPNADLKGLYHVSAAAINKFELLKLTAEVYGKKIEIVPDDELVIDRSLNSSRFTAATGYKAPAWPELIKKMYHSR